tara:strand:+ start:445 stop:597 length:153 start_codon:yes stop_codon:yes gene_type:complete
MSTIKVDTIQKNGGASEISIDKLGGVTAAGSIAQGVLNKVKEMVVKKQKN